MVGSRHTVARHMLALTVFVKDGAAARVAVDFMACPVGNKSRHVEVGKQRLAWPVDLWVVLDAEEAGSGESQQRDGGMIMTHASRDSE